MKQFICSLIIFSLTVKGISQSISPLSKLYVNFSAAFQPLKKESDVSGGYGLTMVVRNKLSFSFSFYDLMISPSNLPNDFDPGYKEGLALFIPYWGPALDPVVDGKMYSITMGRYFKLGKRSWFQLEGGPSMMSGYKTSFKKQPVTTETINYFLGYETSTSSNYSMTKEKRSGLGLQLKADIQQAITRHFALGLSVNSCISAIQSPLFVEFRILGGHFGFPGKKKKG